MKQRIAIITRSQLEAEMTEAFNAHWKTVFARMEPSCCGQPARLVIWNEKVFLRQMLEQLTEKFGLEEPK